MEAEQIIRLIETVSASSLSEFEYQEGDVRPRFKGGETGCHGGTGSGSAGGSTRFDRGNSGR